MLIKLTRLQGSVEFLVNIANIAQVDIVEDNHSVIIFKGSTNPKATCVVKESIDEIAEIQYKWLNPKGAK